MKRYEDDYQREPRRRADPRDARIETRDDRHGRDRVQARDRRELVDDRMDTREPRVDPRDRMDTVVDARMPTSRIDPARANDAARLQPRTDRYGVETRERAPPPPELYKDPRTGALRDARTGELYEEIPTRARGYDDRTDRDRMDRDRMDRDDIPPPTSTRRTREVVDHAPPARGYEDDEFHRGTTKYNDYFVPGIGIDREVIQHEICRYLGNDATVRPFTNKDVCRCQHQPEVRLTSSQGRQGYVVRAYRALTSVCSLRLVCGSADHLRP
jgi:hypothetical protein